MSGDWGQLSKHLPPACRWVTVRSTDQARRGFPQQRRQRGPSTWHTAQKGGRGGGQKGHGGDCTARCHHTGMSHTARREVREEFLSEADVVPVLCPVCPRELNGPLLRMNQL